MDEAIYVQIPAYRDREMARTLRDLYGKAARPEHLRVAVLWQRTEGETLDRSLLELPNLEVLDVPHERSLGCNWARSLLQERWRGEAYTLLLDSHHRFARGWDAAALRMLRDLEASGCARPLLTGYLPAYDPRREPGGRRKQPYKIYPMAREEGILTRLTSFPIPYWTSLRGPIEADFLSLHFIFARGDLNRDLPLDPEVYFFGDEVLLSARAYTAGYDLFHPHAIIGWHCFERATRVGHWADHQGWRERHQRSLRKIRAVLEGRYQGRHGLGTRRTLEQYEERIHCKLIAP
jgi:Glycosyltransferase (GlcNAc)